MSNIILPAESNKRIYSKFKAYEEENFIKCSRWFSNQLEKIFSSEDYEIIINNYINQTSNNEGIVYPFEYDEESNTLKDFLLENISQEDFTNTIIRTAYKILKADVFQYDELEGDEY